MDLKKTPVDLAENASTSIEIPSRRFPKRRYRLLPGIGIAPSGTQAPALSGVAVGASHPHQSFADAPAGTAFADSGGPTIPSPDVQLIFWGKEWASLNAPVSSQSVIDAITSIMAGPYLSALDQYRCSGRGRVRGVTFVTDSDPPNPFGDVDIQQFVLGLIDAETLPEPDEDGGMFACVFVPSNAVYGFGNFSGAHSSIQWNDYDAGDVDSDYVHLAWIGNGGTLASITTTFSHELVESATDPETTNNPAWRQSPCGTPNQCEIGDVCYSTFVLNGVTVQAYWSQRDQSCIVPTASGWRPIGGFFPEGLSVGAVSRNPNQIDSFVCGNDGRVYTSWWTAGAADWSGGADDWRPIGGFFPAGAPVTALSRNPGQLDLFVVGNDGIVYTSWWTDGVADWSGVNDNWRAIGGFFPPGAPIAAVSRNPNQIDLFVVGYNGIVYTSWWIGGVTDWSGAANNWRAIGGYFPAGAPISAVSRNPRQIDLFVCGTDGVVYTAWWIDGAPDWSGVNNDWRAIGGYFPPGAPVSAVCRNPNQIDLFVCGNDGRVYTEWWTDGAADWSGVNNAWRPIGGFFPPGAAIASLARNANQLDIFVCGTDGLVYTEWWTGGVTDWSGANDNWRAIGGVFPAGAPITALSRSPDRLDLLICGNDGRVYTEWWTAGQDWSALT